MKQGMRLIFKYGIFKFLKSKKYLAKKKESKLIDFRQDQVIVVDRYDIGRIRRVKMKSGRIAVCEVIGICYMGFHERTGFEYDMLKYEGMKPIRECSLEEYMYLYISKE